MRPGKNSSSQEMFIKRWKMIEEMMEFFMTYGWAILIVLSALGALLYFGILPPEEFLLVNFCENNCVDTLWTPECEEACVCIRREATFPNYRCTCDMPFNHSLCHEVMEFCDKQSLKLPEGMYCHEAVIKDKYDGQYDIVITENES